MCNKNFHEKIAKYKLGSLKKDFKHKSSCIMLYKKVNFRENAVVTFLYVSFDFFAPISFLDIIRIDSYINNST